MRQYMLERYHTRRAIAIERLGGTCVDCGSSDNLELDHADAAQKSLDLARMWSVSESRFYAELVKCVLRCRSDHMAKSLREGDISSVDHGGGASGKRNCPCTACKAQKAAYMSNRSSSRAA